MWLFTEVGFFSVVAVDKQPDILVVRARDPADLKRFREKYGKKVMSNIAYTPRNDYPARVYVYRENFAQVMAEVVKDLSYSNFKARVEKVDGLDREMLYSQVWYTMTHLEPETARDTRWRNRRAGRRKIPKTEE